MAVLEKFRTPFGLITVTKAHRDGSLAYFQNGCFHSQADRFGVSICGYVHVIYQMIRGQGCRNVLIIGCAGGTLATMLSRIGCRVTIVDINPTSFAIARKYFKLPSNVRCVVRDGVKYIRNARQAYDAVVIDVFSSNNKVPRPFTTTTFFKQVSSRLAPRGLMVMNVITAGDSDRRATKIAETASSETGAVTIFDWPGEQDRNTLIASGLLKRVRVPSGFEPKWIMPEFEGLKRRQAGRRR